MKRLNKCWRLKLIFCIHRLAADSSKRLNKLIRDGATEKQLQQESFKLHAFGICLSRLYKKYSIILEGTNGLLQY